VTDAAAAVRVAEESPRQDVVLAFLEASDAFSAALYPPESNHMIDLSALEAPGVRFAVARDAAGAAIGCGAVVPGGTDADGTRWAEVKRMFVDDAARGRGVGAAVLGELERMAAADGCALLRLETGVLSEGALALYRRAGFRERGPFGSYRPDPLSVFMEKRLDPARGPAP
jgi:putative acetyltransferase